MSKVKKITVSNLKAVSAMTADFNGCTAIITGGNNKGKTSFLRSLFDRVRGIKPDMVLKQGESEGFAEAELTTGEKIRWEFNDKGKGFKEKLTYITEKDIKASLSTALRDKFLPTTFDVDKFLLDQPAKQRKTLQELVGLDFTDIDARYKSAYEDRESKNRAANELRIKIGDMPEKVEAVDTDDLQAQKDAERKRLNDLYASNKKSNEALRKAYNDDKQEAQDDFDKSKKEMEDANSKVGKCKSLLELLQAQGYTGNEVAQWIATLPYIKEVKRREVAEPEYAVEMPDDTQLKQIDADILTAVETNQKAQAFIDWGKRKESSEFANNAAIEADTKVKAIEKERMDLIKSAKMPEGFGFSDDGIEYKGLPFTREQLSSSGIYIAALKLAAMTLGEVRTIHFDASFLDKQSLEEIEQWATSEDCQLLIERPDFEGGEIEYQLIANA